MHIKAGKDFSPKIMEEVMVTLEIQMPEWKTYIASAVLEMIVTSEARGLWFRYHLFFINQTVKSKILVRGLNHWSNVKSFRFNCMSFERSLENPFFRTPERLAESCQ